MRGGRYRFRLRGIMWKKVEVGAGAGVELLDLLLLSDIENIEDEIRHLQTIWTLSLPARFVCIIVRCRMDGRIR